jgi:hypothetical protein
MAVTVIDSNNLEMVLADARDEVMDKPVVLEVKDKGKTPEVPDEPQDEDEDEHGITEAQRKELSAKMLKAIGKKHREMKEAEEYAAAQYNERKLAEGRAAELERQLKELTAKPEPEKKEATKPARHDFGTEDDYIEALSDWKTEQKFAQRDAKLAQEAAEARQQVIIATARERLAKAAELVPDFKEVTESADIIIPNAVVGYMQRSEMFAELGYYLGKNPDIAQKLGKLQPDEQLVTIGKIESKLLPFSAKENNGSKPSTDDGKQVTAKPSNDDTGFSPSNKARSAAPVIKPLNSSDGAQVEIDVRDMDTRAMINDWQKRNKANFNARKRH